MDDTIDGYVSVTGESQEINTINVYHIRVRLLNDTQLI